MESIYLDLDSQHRDRLQHQNPNDYTLSYSQKKDNIDLQSSLNPISDAYPSSEWSWNTTPSIQIITSGDQTEYNTTTMAPTIPGQGAVRLDAFVSEYVTQLVSSGEVDSASSVSIHYQYRVENESNGSGLTFIINTTPNVVSNKLLSGELKIATHGSGYIPGETLKIHRTDRQRANADINNNNVIPYNLGLGLGLTPILMTKGFINTSGYTSGSSYETSGGTGSGMKIILTITKYENDELIVPSIDSTDFNSQFIANNSSPVATYREGDILNVLLEGSTGSIQVMLVDIRFRIGEPYSIDTTNIVNTNTIMDTSSVVYHHANLEPLQQVKSTSGSGSGMILATIDEPISQDSDTSNILLLNRIAYIFEIGTNYEIGDTITIEDRNGVDHTLTIVESSNIFSNKNNGISFYDNELIDDSNYTDPSLGSRSLMISSLAPSQAESGSYEFGLNIFNSVTEIETSESVLKINPLSRIDTGTICVKETLSSLKNIEGNKVFLHDTRTFGLDLQDNYFKGLIFENLTSGERKMIISFNSTTNMLTLDGDLKNSTLQDFWKITNPSTSKKIFIANGSDNPKDYIGNVYEAQIYTGEINNINDIIKEETVSVNDISTKQYKLGINSFDTRIVHQFREIIDYDPMTKMITLNEPLKNLISHSNKYGSTANNVITSVKFIHQGAIGYATTATDQSHQSIEVFPIENSLFTSLNTNKNASGLKINVVIKNTIIDSINDITIEQTGSGYESQGFTQSTIGYNISDSAAFINYTQYGTGFSTSSVLTSTVSSTVISGLGSIISDVGSVVVIGGITYVTYSTEV
tara:strand:+ start:380 stop:2809 length:2430 start_codon:yes stop_codon:yes gene_type:complete